MVDRAGARSDAPVELHREAHLAGLAYFMTIAAGLFAEVHVRGSLRVAGDAAATASNILGAPGFFQLGMFADLVMLASYILVTVLLYRIFRNAGPTLSMAAAAFSFTGIALLAANTGLLAGVPILLDGGQGAGGMETAQRQALAYGLLRLHSGIYSAAGIFFGLYCLAIGRLIIVSRLLPRPIGLLMALAGTVFLIDATLDLLAPEFSQQVPGVVMAISLVGEGALALWLAVAGLSRAGILRTE